jgi:hypothetical protein
MNELLQNMVANIKILFLDFDGVLHPLNSEKENLFCKVHYLERALEGASLKIVITSNWRLTYNTQKMRELLPRSIGELVIGATEVINEINHKRFIEIENYLSTHINSSSIDWRAIDDSPQDFPTDCKNLICCNPISGMGSEEQIQIAKWLKN